jgi:hypothetical protein
MFEEYLEQKFFDEHPEVMKDQFEDAFDKWLTELDVDEWIKLGDDFKASPSKEVAKIIK